MHGKETDKTSVSKFRGLLITLVSKREGEKRATYFTTSSQKDPNVNGRIIQHQVKFHKILIDSPGITTLNTHQLRLLLLATLRNLVVRSGHRHRTDVGTR